MPRQLRVLFASVFAVGSLLIACSGGSSSGTSGSVVDSPETGAHPSETAGIGFGCCVLDARPSVCTLRLGRAKRSADDSCIDGFDGVNPDPSAPGWTQVSDKDGCPVWTPPPGAPKICCGCFDSGAPPADASDASDQ